MRRETLPRPRAKSSGGQHIHQVHGWTFTTKPQRKERRDALFPLKCCFAVFHTPKLLKYVNYPGAWAIARKGSRRRPVQVMAPRHHFQHWQRRATPSWQAHEKVAQPGPQHDENRPTAGRAAPHRQWATQDTHSHEGCQKTRQHAPFRARHQKTYIRVYWAIPASRCNGRLGGRPPSATFLPLQTRFMQLTDMY